MMAKLKPLKLHETIGTSTLWTDELWDKVLTYVLANTATPDALTMIEVLETDNIRLSGFAQKTDYLREFHKYPPTVLLGAFDLMRWRKEQARVTANRARIF